MLEKIVKLITALVAASGLGFGIVKYIQIQEIDAARPYLEKKLAWCEEAVETTAAIAVDRENSSREKKRFWELYWGVMGLVEKRSINNAMIAYGKALQNDQPLQKKSLDLAHACRSELAKDWSPSWERQVEQQLP